MSGIFLSSDFEQKQQSVADSYFPTLLFKLSYTCVRCRKCSPACYFFPLTQVRISKERAGETEFQTLGHIPVKKNFHLSTCSGALKEETQATERYR